MAHNIPAVNDIFLRPVKESNRDLAVGSAVLKDAALGK
jgi:hypothetical protein